MRKWAEAHKLMRARLNAGEPAEEIAFSYGITRGYVLAIIGFYDGNPTGQPNPGHIERKCLGCRKPFKSPSRLIYRCDHCRDTGRCDYNAFCDSGGSRGVSRYAP